MNSGSFLAITLGTVVVILAASWMLFAGAGGGDGPVAGQPPENVDLGTHVGVLYILDAAGRPTRHVLPDDGKPVVIWFWSCLCKCVRECEERIIALLERYPVGTFHFIAVDSNPDDSAEDIAKLREAMESPYVVYRDDRGTTARYLGIAASASVAILDGDGKLRYRGAIDDDLYEPKVSYIHAALDAILAGREIETKTARSYGCVYPINTK